MKKDIRVMSMILALCGMWHMANADKPRNLRIISLAPATTEILFALGLGDEIVGVSSFCNYPPRAQEKEKVGTFSHPNVEKILSLEPDIIFGTGLEQASVVTMLRGLGLKVCVSDPAGRGELFYSINEIGRITGKDKEADDLRNIIMKELIYDYMVKDGTTAPRAVPLLLVARDLERICDHASAIAEDVIYMVQAKLVKHHPEKLK